MSLWPSVETYRLAREAKLVAKTHEDSVYGFFHGGDPRNFTPGFDDDDSTEQERAQWKADCEAWDRGERPDIGPPCEHYVGEKASLIITKSGYGLGVNVYQFRCTGRGCDGCDHQGTPSWPATAEQLAAVREVKRLAGKRKAERRRMRGRR